MQAAITVDNAPRARSRNHPTPALPREDIYGPVHKGLRWILTHVMVRMSRTSFADEASVSRTLSELRQALDLCASHLAHENAHVHAALDRRRPGASARLGGDHEHHEQAIGELRAYADELEQAAPTDRAAFGRRLYLRYSAFVGENLVHMVEEEELAQAVLEEIYTSEELQALQHEIVSSIPLEKMLQFVKIMLAGADPVARNAMVAGVGKVLPVDQMAAIVAGLRCEIGELEWQAVATTFLRSV